MRQEYGDERERAARQERSAFCDRDGSDNGVQNDHSSSAHATSEFSEKGKLSAEDIAKIQKIQRRNLVVAAVLGVILLICGFFAGRALRDRHEHAARADIVCVISGAEGVGSYLGEDIELV
ncbi:MAG: hypothetical protein MR006_05285 [Arcanobacterium sp.]|nr:hypothetical protein [Arcanobacterium sp.]MDY5589388.1 hypothetical protein [Arcanobacterium sp.]